MTGERVRFREMNWRGERERGRGKERKTRGKTRCPEEEEKQVISGFSLGKAMTILNRPR